MVGGIITVSQTIDNFIVNIFNICYQEYCDSYMLYDPKNYKDQPLPPSWQLCKNGLQNHGML